MAEKGYVLITAARNEEAHIEKTIKSVISQTILPNRWVIVSDGSTDRTDEIIRKYLGIHGFIELLRIEGDDKRNFGSQVCAINAGYEQIRHLEYDYIGNLDSDISFDSNYYKDILGKFQVNRKLGLAGGFFWEIYDGKFKCNPFNSSRCVAHAIQLFRRECFEAIGGYLFLKYGGTDWCAEVMARMKGWHVESFQNYKVFHHRHVGAAEGNILRGSFRQGLMDHSVGSHPVFEIFKCFRRVKTKPYFIAAAMRMFGFIWGYFLKQDKIVSKEFIKYLRKEQMERVPLYNRL